MRSLIAITEEYAIGQNNAGAGLFKKEQDTYRLFLSEDVLDTSVVSTPTNLFKEHPSFCMKFTKQAIQLVILQYQGLCDLAKININLPSLLTKVNYRKLDWFKQVIFRHSKAFTQEVWDAALRDLIYSTLDIVPSTVARYQVLGNEVQMCTDENKLIRSTFSYGYTNTLLDIYVQMLTICYTSGQFNYESLLETNYNVQDLRQYILRDYTAYFLETESTSTQIRLIREINKHFLQNQETVSNDTLFERLHEAGIIETDEEDGKYIVQMNLDLLANMYTPTGLANTFEGFDIIRVTGSDVLFDIMPTKKQVSTSVNWEEFINIVRVSEKPEFGLDVSDNDGIHFKVRIKKYQK